MAKKGINKEGKKVDQKIVDKAYNAEFVDEFKIYAYARTAAQILSDYQTDPSDRGSTAVLGSESSKEIVEGLIGYWDMDEYASGTTPSTRIDYSGRSNDLVDNNTTYSGIGVYGYAADFESGNSEYLSIGDTDAADTYLANYDFIICTAEKLDSLIRHHTPWLVSVSVVIIDEIHLLNDPSRGPTLEILITILKRILKNSQIIGLSATIGNSKELAKWLDAKLVVDDWRPVELKKGIYFNGEIDFKEWKQC